MFTIKFQDLRWKTTRLVAFEGTLIAHIDARHKNIDDRIGQLFHDKIEKKLYKLQE